MRRSLRTGTTNTRHEAQRKLLVLLFLSSALLAGCNTARGVGEDIQGLGHAISHAVS
ncbi:MAG: entericidin A/B family lipoprotein [Klebsiella variicola]|nr:entericidin A/B family lipoprotein [Klebsiella variicola]